LLATLDAPDWPAEQAGSQSEAFHRHVHQLELVLDGLPAPPPTARDDLLVVSATGLITYATCPQRYFWTAVDPLPRRPSAAARHGAVVHRKIEMHNLGAVPLQEYDASPFPFEQQPESWEAIEADPFTTFLNSRFAVERPRFVEVPFELHLDADARVRGRIDAIYEPKPGSWEIVDFKSGRPSRDPKVRIQLEAYGLAVDEVELAPDPPDRLAVTFAYLGNGLTEVTEHVDDHWLEQARTRLVGIIGSIRAERWEPRPQEGCRHCDFLRFCPAGQASEAGTGYAEHNDTTDH
jgi:DNA helicase-2/ATP-dependent DNA helicase PcrA